jgi:hypothetical protein
MFYGEQSFIIPHGIITLITVILSIAILYFIYKLQQGGDERVHNWENYLKDTQIEDIKYLFVNETPKINHKSETYESCRWGLSKSYGDWKNNRLKKRHTRQ